MVQRKTLMIIGAGFLQLPAIETAREMGLRTVVTDYNPDSPGMRLADVPMIISTRDHEGTVRNARAHVAEGGRIDGVITVGTDASMTVAAVANALGLPGNKFEAAEAATNKVKMRKHFQDAGVPSPAFAPCWTLGDAQTFIKSHPYPAVLKPADNMGARGVTRVDTDEELQKAFDAAKDASPSGELIIEEFLEGHELSIDALIYKGEISITGIADRIIGFPPHFVELGHILPSSLSQDIIDDACEVMRKGIRALCLEHGAAKGDIKITENGAVIVELAGRLSGGFMSAYTYPLATGINLIKAAIKIALGDSPGHLKPKWNRIAYEHAIIPQPGYVLSINGEEKAQALNGVEDVFLRIAPGDRVRLPTSNVEKSGNIIVCGKTREKVLTVMEEALKTIKIELSATSPLTVEKIRSAARKKMGRFCFACKICDGFACAGMVPGMGGVDTGASFINNLRALEKYKIMPTYIHDKITPDSSATILGYTVSLPLLAAPVTGTDVNMNFAMAEHEYAQAVVQGCRDADIIPTLGDGAQPDMYTIGLRAASEAGGLAIAFFKPRAHQNEIFARIKAAEESGCMAVGCDIDAGAFITMTDAHQSVAPKSQSDLAELISATTLPFVVKGIMTPHDAEAAVDAGARVIYVSNHGGRVLDHMPGTADILSDIVMAVGGKADIWVDGGVRTGRDIFKLLALGAQAVLIGRPLTIAAVGAGAEGVAFYVHHYKSELEQAMLLAGCRTIADIKPDMIKYIDYAALGK